LEVFPALSALRYCMRRLPRWMRPKRRSVEWDFWLASNRVIYQPLGVVGVIAPWNYPCVLLALAAARFLSLASRMAVHSRTLTLRAMTFEILLRSTREPARSLLRVRAGALRY
jgi:coniferyl-aldehyde dehydrogenase